MCNNRLLELAGVVERETDARAVRKLHAYFHSFHVTKSRLIPFDLCIIEGNAPAASNHALFYILYVSLKVESTCANSENNWVVVVVQGVHRLPI